MVKAKDISIPENSVPKDVTPFSRLNSASRDAKRAELARNMESLRARDAQMVRCRFKNYEHVGGDLKFCFKKYKHDPMETYHFEDGGVYTVPIAVIKHINQDCYVPSHKYSMDETGKYFQKIGSKFQRFELIPLEFIDTEDLSPASSLVTVEHM